MKETKWIMGMPITIHIVDSQATAADISSLFDYFTWVDETFSTYKKNSEISRINRGLLLSGEYSQDMQSIFALCEQTKQETQGYFDMFYEGKYDPSGVVKGWAIQKAYELLLKKEFINFFIDAGGDIQASGKNGHGHPWKIGIRNPFNRQEHIKVLSIANQGVATSGTYIRGEHIYDPKEDSKFTLPNSRTAKSTIVSLTVIGPRVLDADRFATAAFAMGEKGIYFIEALEGFEGYMIDEKGTATMTSGFEKYTI